MTIIEAINAVDTLCPNSYSQNEKVAWLSKVDGIIKREVIDTHEYNEGEAEITFTGYNDSTDLNTELIAKEPYADLYVSWLESKVDYHNREYGKFNNSAVVFNTHYTSFQNYYNRTHKPKAQKFTFF